LRPVVKAARMTELSVAVLALEPHANGLAYASFAEGGDLVDWGSFDVRARPGASKRRVCRQLIHRLSPAIIGLEDVDQPDCRRSKRMQAFLRAIRQDVLDAGFKVVRVPRSLMAGQLLGLTDWPASRAFTPGCLSQSCFPSIYERIRSGPVRKAMRIGLVVLGVARGADRKRR
jgi:hypothetical protein